MKVTLVYPPNRNIPSSPYGALPLLAGCLGAAGHRVQIVDANLEVFERLIQRQTIDGLHAEFQASWSALADKPVLTPPEMRHLQGLAELAVVPIDRLYGGAKAGEILRNQELFSEPENVQWAYDTLANVLRAVYAMNPVYYLLKPGAMDEYYGYLAGPRSNPVKHLVDTTVIDQILATEPDLVGVCVPFNEQLVEAFSLLAELKRRAPHIKTIVGGAIITAYAKELCADERLYQYADYALPGEADLAFPQFCTLLENGGDLSEVPGLWRRVDGAIVPPTGKALPNLNEVAAPDFSSLPLDRYFLPELVVNYQTSRGCYYGKCTFCSFDIKENFRLRKPSLVCDDIAHVQAQTGARHFIFWDPLTPPKLMKGVSEWNKDRPENERIYWGAETKFEKLFTDRNYTDLLYDGGARFLQFGFESGSQRVLDLMVKGNDLSRVDLMMDTLRDSKIKVSVQWFIGFPGETEDEAKQSFRYLDERRDAVLLSSYMGTFTLSRDDDIYRSNGELYDLDIFQRDDGAFDFRYRNPAGDHYNRDELDAAFLARGDAETVTRMAFFLYLTQQPERAHEVAGFHRVGALPDTFDEVADEMPTLPDYNFVRSYDFDIFTAPEKQGVGPEGSALPKRKSHAVFNTPSQRIYNISDRDLELIRLADGKRTAAQIVAQMGGDVGEQQARLLFFVRRGVLRVPLGAPVTANA